jgi:hypothetical protein
MAKMNFKNKRFLIILTLAILLIASLTYGAIKLHNKLADQQKTISNLGEQQKQGQTLIENQGQGQNAEVDPMKVIDCEFSPDLHYWNYWEKNYDYNKHTWQEDKDMRQGNYSVSCGQPGSAQYLNAYVFKDYKLFFKEEMIFTGRFFADNDGNFYIVEGIGSSPVNEFIYGFMLTKYEYDSQKDALVKTETTNYTTKEKIDELYAFEKKNNPYFAGSDGDSFYSYAKNELTPSVSSGNTIMPVEVERYGIVFRNSTSGDMRFYYYDMAKGIILDKFQGYPWFFAAIDNLNDNKTLDDYFSYVQNHPNYVFKITGQKQADDCEYFGKGVCVETITIKNIEAVKKLNN